MLSQKVSISCCCQFSRRPLRLSMNSSPKRWPAMDKGCISNGWARDEGWSQALACSRQLPQSPCRQKSAGRSVVVSEL